MRNFAIWLLFAVIGAVAIDYLPQSQPTVESQPRSPRWAAARAEALALHPSCEACGCKVGLQVHHIKPFHLFPELELEQSNLIVLCGPQGKDCHIRIGHNFNYASYNLNARQDAAAQLKRIRERP